MKSPPPQPNPWPKFHQAAIQSLCSGAFLLFAFYVFYNAHADLAVASLGASAVIAFYFPNSNASRPRFFLGGYAFGILCGGLCYYILYHLCPPAFVADPRSAIFFCALAVTLTCFFMSFFNVHHPTAAAIAIAMVTAEDPINLGIATYMLIVILVVIRWVVHHTFGPHFTLPPGPRPAQPCLPAKAEDLPPPG